MKNPTKSIFWNILKNDYKRLKKTSISKLFENKKRFENFSINYKNSFLFDFSKNIIDDTALDNLFSFAKDMNLNQEKEKMFKGEKINITENRAVLHTALRDFSDNPIILDGKDIKKDIAKELEKMKLFDSYFSKNHFTDIVNLGIGGSDLGIRMVCNGLKDFSRKNINIHFVSNADPKEIKDVLKKINITKTLFVICSKTFCTQETMANALYAKRYFIEITNNHNIAGNFVAISANLQEAINFGIREENIFRFWEWVGGRYSIWSSVGLSACLYIGYENFIKFLEGGQEIDIHFRKEKIEKNIPIIMGLISVFYNNFFGTQTNSIICYSSRMKYFLPYLQQCIMESNGKNVDRDGNFINYQTSSIIWGGIGTDSQHSFSQLLHQGTKLVPSDFITFVDNFEENKLLFSNFLAQTHALAFGDKKKDNTIKYKIFKGNKPSNSLIFKKLDPYSLGMLTAIYEHKTFVEGILWNIFSFDQWGVELGKKICNTILNKFDNNIKQDLDIASENILNFAKSK